MDTRIPTRAHGNAAGAIKDTGAKCRTAKELANVGDYEAAREVMHDLWDGIGQRPRTEGLAPEDQAEVLLRAGALSGWLLGSSEQVPGAEGFAKDLISESIRMFEQLDDQEKIAEAQSDLALCYWREGAMDEARVWFRKALSKATDPANRLRILARSTTIEYSSNRYADALALLDQARPLLDYVDDAPRGCYHMQRADVFERLGGTENLDRALIESAAASIHFEKANHQRYFARVQNKMGSFLLQLRRYEEALTHLERARHAFVELKEVGTAAQVNETRARVFIAQQRYVDAEKIAFAAVSELEKGDEQSLLAEALETQAVAMARMGRFQSALGILKRAAHIAETAGDSQLSGKIFLTILEEVKSFLSPSEITEIYREADDRLPDGLDAETVSRLRACVRLSIGNATPANAEAPIPGSFEQEVHKRESDLIGAALAQAGGSVTRAARLLGLTHQGLCYIINHRHKHLLGARAPIRVRRKSIIKKR